MNRAHPRRCLGLLLEVGQQLLDDGVTPGAGVGRVDGVAVVVERCRVLDLDHDDAREAGSRPLLVELVRVLLLDDVVAGEVEAGGEVGLQCRVRRLGTEAGERVRKVPVIDEQRIARLGMRVPALGQQHVGADVHRPAPELRQQLALDALVADVFRVGRPRDLGDDLVERDGHRPALRLDAHLGRGAVEVAGRAVPLLALATVHRQLDV